MCTQAPSQLEFTIYAPYNETVGSLPSGTVKFLSIDIEGSTSLAQLPMSWLCSWNVSEGRLSMRSFLTLITFKALW